MEFDQVCAQVLGRDPFSTLKQACASVQEEGSRRILMIQSISQDRLALVAIPLSWDT